MSPMRTHKTKPASERAEEPQEPVKATESAKPDHEATDALLAAIEDVLDPETAEEVQPKPEWMTDENFRLLFASFDPARDTIQFLPTPRTEDEQAILYEQFRREREQRWEPEDDGIPWEEIAKLPPPGPGGRNVEFMEPQEIDWAIAEPGDDPCVIVARPRTRVIHVTRAMWEEARRGLMDRGQRYHGAYGMCPKCGWPLAGPGRFPCNQGDGSRPAYLDPRRLGNITTI